MISNPVFLQLTAKLDANDDAGYDACLQSKPEISKNIVASEDQLLDQSPARSSRRLASHCAAS